MPLDPVYYPCCWYLGAAVVFIVLMDLGSPWDNLLSVGIGAILLWTGGTVNSSSNAGELYLAGIFFVLGGIIKFFVAAANNVSKPRRK